MSKIDGILDLSRFVRTLNRVTLNNSVKLIIGEVVIEVNGYIISQKSSVLEELVCSQNEIFLDEFVGEEDGIQHCIELLYGGTVELSLVRGISGQLLNLVQFIKLKACGTFVLTG